ncbi:MAG: glutathione synthase, partial [Pseudomonadota bacterium]
MALDVAVQMDPITAIDIAADSTFALMLEGQARGHRLRVYGPDALRFDEGRVLARAQEVTVQNVKGDHARLSPADDVALGDVDVVLMRQDPPFDMQYIAAAQLLEMIHPRTLVVNDPRSVRDAPEKLFALTFPNLIAPTLVTRDPDAVRAFRSRHRDIIVKPLFGNGGVGVFHNKPDDENLGSLLETFLASSREQIMVQAYLPAIRAGDKRVILVDG